MAPAREGKIWQEDRMGRGGGKGWAHQALGVCVESVAMVCAISYALS